VNPLAASRTPTVSASSKPRHQPKKEQFYQLPGEEMIPFGGDVDNEEDLPLVGLQAHFLAVAILLRQKKKSPIFFVRPEPAT